jgi:tetratricopeptide (TPR) repeat protein
MRGIALLLLALLAACSPGSTGPGSGAPGLDVADAAMRGGSPEIALQIVGGILARDPNNVAALLAQGDAFTALQRLNEAGVSYTRALAIDPTSVGGHIGLGRVRLASDPEGAEALFLEALQREPRNGVALNDLGIARDLLGRHTDAQTAYRQALAVVPDMTAAQVNLALSMAMSGHGRDAIQLLRPLASAPGTTRQVRHDLAAVLTMGGDKAEAERILSEDLPANEVQQALDAYASARPVAEGSVNTSEPVPVDKSAAVLVRPARAEAVQVSVVPATVRAGTMQAQLAAVPSEDAAQAEWQRLQEKLPDVLGARQPVITRIERDGRVFWRLRAGGFADANEATEFCERVRAGGNACIATQ